MFKKFCSSLLILLLILPTFMHAKSANWESLQPEDFRAVISDFPALGTPESDADYKQLLELQQSRNPEECQFGNYLKWPSYEAMFSQSKPDYLDDAQLPIQFSVLLDEAEVEKTRGLMKKVLKISTRITKYYKDLYQRERPSRVEKKLEPCVEVPPGATSYPSSHTAKGAVVGCLLAKKFAHQGQTKRAEEILAYGEYMGDLRIIVGVHHPTDVTAGRAIGYALCEKLMEDADFEKKLLRR